LALDPIGDVGSPTGKVCQIQKCASCACPFYVKYSTDGGAKWNAIGGTGCAKTEESAAADLKTHYIDGGYCGCDGADVVVTDPPASPLNCRVDQDCTDGFRCDAAKSQCLKCDIPENCRTSDEAALRLCTADQFFSAATGKCADCSADEEATCTAPDTIECAGGAARRRASAFDCCQICPDPSFPDIAADSAATKMHAQCTEDCTSADSSAGNRASLNACLSSCENRPTEMATCELPEAPVRRGRTAPEKTATDGAAVAVLSKKESVANSGAVGATVPEKPGTVAAAGDLWQYCCEGKGVCRQGPGCTLSKNACLADEACKPVKREDLGPVLLRQSVGGATSGTAVGTGWSGVVKGADGEGGCTTCECTAGTLSCEDAECPASEEVARERLGKLLQDLGVELFDVASAADEHKALLTKISSIDGFDDLVAKSKGNLVEILASAEVQDVLVAAGIKQDELDVLASAATAADDAAAEKEKDSAAAVTAALVSMALAAIAIVV
jgi:hypothetical protein